MRLTPRTFTSLAVGGILLTLITPKVVVHAEPVAMPSLIPGETGEARLVLQNEHTMLDEIRATPEEIRFMDLANEERARRGLKPLRFDPLLTFVARKHSAEMRDLRFFDHKSPLTQHRTPLDRYLKAVPDRPEYACVGENLYWSTLPDVGRGHKAFMDSPTHRDNVLYGPYDRIGVGIVRSERGEFWVTQMFLTNNDPVGQRQAFNRR
jgi:uncharacterized protein YkwD